MKLIKTLTALIAISLFGASYANAGSHEYTYSGPADPVSYTHLTLPTIGEV